MDGKISTKGRMKIAKHTQRGDLQRLKHYLRKYQTGPNIRLQDDQTMLHIACKHKHDHILRYLLKNGADVGLQDKFGNIALHYALRLCTAGDKYAYQDLVKPLLEVCGHLLDVADNRGVSARQMLDYLVAGSQNRVSSSETSESSEDEESRWNEKMAAELEQECAGAGGRYESDYFHELEEEMETHAEWTERIHHEYKRKHQPKVPKVSTKKPKQDAVTSGETGAAFQRRLEQEYQEYLKRAEVTRQQRLRLRKAEYERHWKVLLECREDGMELSYATIPWPCEPDNLSALQDSLLCDIDRKDKTELKKYLREQQIRWHPDKFLQKFGNHLSDDKDKILSKVKEISQAINSLSEKLLN